MSVRECGECSLCCKLPGVYGGDVSKPPGTWCEHCEVSRGGIGCVRYETRPDPCRHFECLWLINEGLPEELKPSRCHVVFSELSDDVKDDALKAENGTPIHVDVVAMEDGEVYRLGESMKRWVVKRMVDVVKARGCTVAVLNNGKGKLV